MSGREAMLSAVRAAVVAGAGPAPASARNYRQSWHGTPEALLDRLETRLKDYQAGVTRVAAAADIATAAAECLRARGIASLLIPADLPVEWRPAGPVITEDAGQAAIALNAIAGAMTGCALAIAETGTLVLDAGAHQGRRLLTLLPDYWLCVVLAEQVVGLFPEAIMALRGAAGRPLTFASGPSATSDIELSRVLGVHGPRHLDVLLVVTARTGGIAPPQTPASL